MPAIDFIVANVNPFMDVVGVLVSAIDEWSALDPATRPTLAEHMGLTDDEYAGWGGPGTRDGRTTVGDAFELQAVILARLA